MARLLKRVSNAKLFEKRIFYYSNGSIVYYNNTKHLEIHLGFIEAFSAVVNIQTAILSAKFNVYSEFNI